MNIFVVAAALFPIVGGPSVGKTSIINALREEGHLTCKETATDLILEAQAEGHPTPWDEAGFEVRVFDEKVRREEEARKIATLEGKSAIFIDRGILDQLVYIEILGKQDSEEAKYVVQKINELDPSSRYTAIFVVEPHTSTHFELTQAEFRRESSSEALMLAHKLAEVYTKTGLPIITVPPDMTPQARAQFIVNKTKEFSS